MKRRGSRAAIIAVLLLGLLIFGIVYFTWTTVTDVFQPANANATSTKPFVINSGESGAQIADALQAKGLIRNALAFRIWARIKGLDTQLQAGAYNLSPSWRDGGWRRLRTSLRITIQRIRRSPNSMSKIF